LESKSRNKKLIIKLVFGLALLLFISFKVYASATNEDFQNLNCSENYLSLFLIAVVLMPLNWAIESVKWHILVSRIKPQPFIITFRDVLAGVSTSLLTPNRIGNFIGRTVRMEKKERTKAIVSTIHSNLAQFAASILFGCIGLFLVVFDQDFVEISTVRLSAFCVLAGGLGLYYFPKIINFNPVSKLYSDQLKEGIVEVQSESFGLKTLILFLSLLRYCVFIVQFYLLLLCFESNLEIGLIIPAISVVFLITTIIPSFLFGKLFVREASALFVLTSFGISTPVILYSVFILWLLNLALPSIVGGLILMKSK
jgi:hypothetical protein